MAEQQEVETPKEEKPFSTVTEDLPKPDEKLNRDLNLKAIGLAFAAERESQMAINADLTEKKISRGEPIADLETVLQTTEGLTGLTPQETVSAFELQGIPLNQMFERITQKGEPINDVIDSFQYHRDVAGLTPQQRRVKQRGQNILLEGFRRTQTGEKKLDPKTKEETLDQLASTFDPKKRKPKIFGFGGTASGEAEDAVVKPGDPGYDRLERFAQKITDPKIADDPERAQMLLDMVTYAGPRSMGSMVREGIAEKHFQEMLGKLYAYDLNTLAREEKAKRGSPEYEALKKRAWQNALYETTLLRATNKHVFPMFISYDMIDPALQLGDPASDKDTLWIEKAWDGWSNVRMEVVGLDAKGTPVYRLTHPVWHMFEMADAPQSMVVGVGERLAYGPEDESIMEAIKEGSLEGLRSKRDFLKAGMSTEAAENSTLGAVAAGSLGFGAAVATPDLFMGLAGVARVSKKVAEQAKSVRAFKTLAPRLVDNLGEGAESLAKAQEIIMDGVSDALAAGDYDKALDLLEQAKEYASKGDESIAAVREDNKVMATEVDRLDTVISSRLTDEVPEMGFKEGRRLASQIPGAFGATAQNLHPSIRRVDLRGPADDQLAPFYEILGTNLAIESLQDTIRLLKKGDIDEQFLIAYVDEANNFSSKLTNLMIDSGVSTQQAGLTVAQRQASGDLVDFLRRYESTRLLKDDPAAWQRRVTELALKLPFPEDNPAVQQKFLSELSKLVKPTIKNVKKLKKNLKVKVSPEDARNATARAVKAVEGQLESRAAAMAFVRKNIADQAGVKADPLIVPITEKHKAVGEAGLSPDGLSFLRQLELAVPNLRGDEALRVVMIEDRKAAKWAKKNNSTIRKYYEENFRLSKVFEDIKPDQKTPTVAPKETPAEPEIIDLNQTSVERSTPEITDPRDPTFGRINIGRMGDGPDGPKIEVEPKLYTEGQSELGLPTLGTEFRVVNIELQPELRNQGLGVELYLRALSEAKNADARFVSDVNPSPEALRVYNSLERYGIKFRRQGVTLPNGDIGTQLIIDAEDLKRVDLDGIARAHSRRKSKTPSMGTPKVFDSMAGDVATNPVVIERLDDGRIFLKALTDTATADDFIRALGSASRRNLSKSDMKALTAWLGGRGIKVGFSGAVFTGADPDVINLAEDEFASAYLAYVKSGKADSPKIKGGLNKASEWLKDTYASATGRSVGGPPEDMNPDLKKVLDKMLARPSEKVALPNIFKITKDALFTPKVKGSQIDVGQEILRMTQRLGFPMSQKDLDKQMLQALEAYNAGKLDQAVIRLPGPISFSGRAPKDDYTLDELRIIQGELEQAKHLEMSDTSRIALGGAHMAITERTASELIDQVVFGRGKLSVFRSLFLGSDAYVDMRSLPLIVREAIQAGARKVQQAVGDTVTLIYEKDVDNLMRYLTGQAEIQFKQGGRSAISAGHNSVETVMDSLRGYFEAVASTEKGRKQMAILEDFVMRVRERGSTAQVVREMDKLFYNQEELMDAFNEVVKGAKANRFLRESFQAAGFKEGSNNRLLPKYFTQSRSGATRLQDPGGLLEVFLYLGDRTRRPYQGSSLFFTERMAADSILVRSETSFQMLYEEVAQLFKEDPNVPNRIAVLVAAHGHAHKAKMEWVDMGIAADEELVANVKKYLVGEFVSDDVIAEVKNFVEAMGNNPNMVESFDLYGVKMYVPEQGRKRLSMALDQAMDPELREAKRGDIFEEFWNIGAEPEEIMRRGAAGPRKKEKMSMALFYRVWKTRQVRGHYITKTKHFWMNWFDTFNQTALATDYRTAMIQTLRLLPQNLMMNPAGQSVVAAARMVGKGQKVEDVRRALQAGGDVTAKWMSNLTRASKYHINVNDILRGGDTMILIGGRPYKAQDVRDHFLGAGIFASFDTSQLGTKIQNVGHLFLDEAAKAGMPRRAFKYVKDNIKGATEDLAEAWSERERIGLALTLMEAGIDPRTAARITIDALYDYAGSMSKADRHFLVGCFFPFWAFQKNANRQLFDTIFSPEGAYRLGVMRRVHDKGSDAISELLYNASVDENGIDVDALPPELRQSYFAFKNQVYENLTPDGRVSPMLREEMRMFVANSSIGFYGGQMLSSTAPLSDELRAIADQLKDPETGEPIPIDLRALSSYYVPRTDRSSMASYQRNRISVRWPYTPPDYEDVARDPEIPKEFRDNMKTWLDLYRMRNPDAPYAALFLPETSYMASYNHFAHLISFGLLLAGEVEKLGDKWFTDEDDGADIISPLVPFEALVNPARSPMLKDPMAAAGMTKPGMPKRISASVVHWAEYLNIMVLELDEKDDPWSLVEPEGDEAPDLSQYDREPLSLVKEGKVYYLAPGIPSMAFENSGLQEINNFMLLAERTGPERAAGLRGQMQRAIRVATGLELKDISRAKSARSDMFKAKEEASDKTKKKLMGKN